MRRVNSVQLTANHQDQLFQVLLMLVQVAVILVHTVLVQLVLNGGAQQCMSTRCFVLLSNQCLNEHQLVTPASAGCTTRICTRGEAIQVCTNQSLALFSSDDTIMVGAH